MEGWTCAFHVQIPLQKCQGWDMGPNPVKEPLQADWSFPDEVKVAPCLKWTAVVTLKGDYNLHTVEANVEPRVDPGCEQLRVTLWHVTAEAAAEGDCVHDIMLSQQLYTPLPEHSVDVRFEDVSPGNYCVRVPGGPYQPFQLKNCSRGLYRQNSCPAASFPLREGSTRESTGDAPVLQQLGRLVTLSLFLPPPQVTPLCNMSGCPSPCLNKSSDCLSLTSQVLELPVPQQTGRPSGGGAPEGRLLWLLLVPLLVASALVMAGAVWWARHRAWLAARSKKATVPVPPGTVPPRQPPVEVRVVYSRDSEAHVAAVGQLCALLQSELGMRVEYDEAATGPAHVTHDWALAMAHLPCPRFNEASQGGKKRVKMLVLESDGALLKHQAYRLHKDVGVASESSVDELYHTTYAALLSQQAQALGDYCHLLVARLPYTTLPDRLDLVPEKRFLLPDHLPHLLEALLHDPAKGPGGQQQQRIAAALRSEARARLDRALALAGSAHQGDGQGGLAHLRDVLLGSEEQV
ncbi:hypothetical protein HPB48_000363 [Haemaphysalis longicornis]|uniref:SEFIR domain-containing protein n=1 Tax=Haemaphysalis longicornis TaxID=44386 RepID=A0A9J6H673_HAELO|nr:hypothetical protein HPB48_000363 [Haemaphysalis longicornis]